MCPMNLDDLRFMFGLFLAREALGKYPTREVGSRFGQETGKKLFYRWGNKVWVVDVRTDAGCAASKPRVLFDQSGYEDNTPVRGWDISPDGQRFLMVKLEERTSQPVTEMILVQNWFEELRRLCPTGKK